MQINEWPRIITFETEFVVVDLWKTLVPLTGATKRKAFDATAGALEISVSALSKPWQETRHLRETMDLHAYLVLLSETLGRSWSTDQIRRAMFARQTIHGRGFLHPLEDGYRMLQRLKCKGIPVVVISNGSSDVRSMFEHCSINRYADALILSSEVGVMKPTKEIYQLAADISGVALQTSVYIGDGMDEELEGAASAGFSPVLVRRGSVTEWGGLSVASLDDIHFDNPSER